MKYFVVVLLLMMGSVALGQTAARKAAFRDFQAKKYARAAEGFYNLSRSTKKAEERLEAKYYLAISLAKLDLLQIASFPLVDVVRSGPGKYQKKALNQLAVIADRLNEPGLLNYTLKKLTPDELTDMSRAIFYLRLSEIEEKENNFEKALMLATQSQQANPKSDEALYQMASLQLQLKAPEKALEHFFKIYEKHEKKSVRDPQRGLLILNIARSYYQMKEWEKSAQWYRQIPKDHVYYRQTLMELSWALFRKGRFRSALSPLQTLMTPYYAQFYDPETLLLSGVIFFFSCQYDEAMSVAAAFEKNYDPAMGQINTWLTGSRTSNDYWKELESARAALKNLNKTGKIHSTGQLPFFVLRTILDETNVKMLSGYYDKLESEKKLLAKHFGKNRIATYGTKIIEGRRKATQGELSKRIQDHLKSYLLATSQFSEQMGFLKYEVLNGQRTSLKGKMASVEQNDEAIDKDMSRDYYIQNGYRYWPFQGEFWRDEIGSYQYVGINRCQN